MKRLLARGPAQQATAQANFQSALARARHNRLQLRRTLRHSQPARTLRMRELFRLLRMAGHEDFRRGAIGSDKWRREFGMLDAIVFAFVVDVAVRAPESIAHGEKLFGARVTLVVRKKITVTALLFARTTGDHIERDTSLNKRRHGVHL